MLLAASYAGAQNASPINVAPINTENDIANDANGNNANNGNNGSNNNASNNNRNINNQGNKNLTNSVNNITNFEENNAANKNNNVNENNNQNNQNNQNNGNVGNNGNSRNNVVNNLGNKANNNVRPTAIVRNGVVESIKPVSKNQHNSAPIPPPPGVSEIKAPTPMQHTVIVADNPPERREPRVADAELNAYEDQVATSLRSSLKADLERYCMDYCSILSMDVIAKEHFDTGNSDLGFENVSTAGASSRKFRVKMVYTEVLVDSRYGSENIEKLQKLFDRILPRYGRPITLSWSRVSFPENAATQKSEGDVRREFSTQVRGQIERIIAEFCPNECRLTHINVDVDRASMDEAERGSVQRFLFARDGRGALYVKGVTARVNMNSAMDSVRRAQITELMHEALLPFGAVSLDVSAVAFPRSAAELQKDLDDSRRDPYGLEKFASLMKIFKENMVGKEVYKETNTRESSGSRETLASRDTLDTKALTERNSSERELEKTHSTNSSKQVDATERTSQKTESALENRALMWIAIGAGIILIGLMVAAWLWIRSLLRSPQMNAVLEEGQHKGKSYATSAEQQKPDEPIDENVSGTGLMKSRLEIDNLKNECLKIFVAEPKIARETFTRVLREDGIQEASKYVVIFGEIVIYELLKDLDLKEVLNELADYVHLNAPQVKDGKRLELLRQLKLKLTAAKMKLLTNRTLDVFDFLKAWSPRQIFELTRDETPQVQGVVLTQLSTEKRKLVFELFGEKQRSALLQALSKIDLMPREFLIGTAENMKSKAMKNPRFDAENVRGSDVLLDLLASSTPEQLAGLMADLDRSNPEAAWRVRSSFVSANTLLWITDSTLVDLMLDLEIKEIGCFLYSSKVSFRKAFFAKIPRDIGSNWAENMDSYEAQDPEIARSTEQKLIAKVRNLAAKGIINLTEINEKALPRAEANSVVAMSATTQSTTAKPPTAA